MRNIFGYTLRLKDEGLPIKGCYENASGAIVEKWERPLTVEENILFVTVKAAWVDTVYTILPNQQFINADGEHTAIVTTLIEYLDIMPDTDTITIDGVPHEIDLVAGRAELEFTSTTSGTIIRLDYHGQKAIIEAV